MNIVLTGFMGTGKTEVGKLLAEKLGWQFFNTDSIIEEETGFSISEIFAKKGEKHFRELEAKAVALLSLLDNAVISCGGGVVLRKTNLDALEQNGVVVCLTARPEVIHDRVQKVSKRPLLKGEGLLIKIQVLLKERAPLYKRCHVSVDTSDIDQAKVVEQILSSPELVKKLNR